MKYLTQYGNFIKEGHWEKSIDLVCNDCGYQWKGFESSEIKAIGTLGKRGCICPECMSDNIDYDHSKDEKDKKEK